MLTEIMYRRSQDLSPLIHPYCVKQALCDVNPEDAHLWFHWTRLLWRYGWHRTPKSLWLIEVDPHRGGSISLLPDGLCWHESCWHEGSRLLANAERLARALTPTL